MIGRGETGEWGRERGLERKKQVRRTIRDGRKDRDRSYIAPPIPLTLVTLIAEYRSTFIRTRSPMERRRAEHWYPSARKKSLTDAVRQTEKVNGREREREKREGVNHTGINSDRSPILSYRYGKTYLLSL